MLEQMWYDIWKEAQLYVLIIAGIGAMTLAIRMITSIYVANVAKAAGNMAKTKNRFIKSVRNAYDKEMLMHEQVDNVEIFVEKEISELRFLGMSITFVDRLNVQGILLILCTCCFGLIDAFYGDWDIRVMGNLLCATIVVFAILVTQENLLRLIDGLDLIEVRIIDYLENSVKSDMLMGERNLRKKERSLLFAHQMGAKAMDKLPKMELAAGQEGETVQAAGHKEMPDGQAKADPMVADQSMPEGMLPEQEAAFIEMLNEFFI